MAGEGEEGRKPSGIGQITMISPRFADSMHSSSRSRTADMVRIVEGTVKIAADTGTISMVVTAAGKNPTSPQI